MADNYTFKDASGTTITASSDDIGSVQYPRVKITQGADGASTDVSSAAPLQVSVANTAANATAIKVDGSAVTQPVSVATVPSHAVTNAGTFAVQDSTTQTNTGNAATSLGVMDDWDNGASDGASVSGDVAHDTADAGEPVKIGLKAESDLTGITLVADGDRENAYGDLDGLQLIKPWTTFGTIKSERVSATSSISTAFSTFGAVSSMRNYIAYFNVWNSSATDAYVDIRDGTGGSILFTIPAPKGGGSVHALPIPLRQTTSNTALAYHPSAAVSTLYLTAIGFQSLL